MNLYADDSLTDRRLFTFFFCRPDHFKRVMAALGERVQRVRGAWQARGIGTCTEVTTVRYVCHGHGEQ